MANASRWFSCCSRLACPIAEEFNLATGVGHFPCRVKVDLVFRSEVRADQAPGIKAATGDSNHDRFGGRFGKLAPACTLKLNGRYWSVIRKHVVYGDDGASIFLVRYIHHLRVNVVAFFIRLKFNIED